MFTTPEGLLQNIYQRGTVHLVTLCFYILEKYVLSVSVDSRAQPVYHANFWMLLNFNLTIGMSKESMSLDKHINWHLGN